MENNPLISIVIPTYEMLGDGVYFLDLNLKNIKNQTYKNFEVIVTDHSVGLEIEHLCIDYSKELNIKYIRNEKNRGESSSNMNNGIINCSGDIIKILMQDDYFYDNNSLHQIVKIFNKNKDIKWLVSSCVYGNKDGVVMGQFKPQYSNNIINGENKIGPPCVLTIKNESPLLFNEDLIWMMDCEYYKRYFDKYGEPFILNENHIFVTQHKNQVTNFITEERKNKEVELIQKTYDNN
jgi:glycosyltransferase involved in cell wall biosynthesis